MNRDPLLVAGPLQRFYQGAGDSLFYERLGRDFTLGERVKFSRNL